MFFKQSPAAMQNKLYGRSKEFNNFAKINNDRIAELKSKFALLYEDDSYQGLDKYLHILSSLVNNINCRFISFDEKIYLLITCVDPELITLREYLKTDLETIREFDSKKAQRQYNIERKKEILLFETRIREKLGFYDKYIIKYETKFYDRFILNKPSQSIKKDYSKIILNSIIYYSDFSSISKERLTELQLIADNWLNSQSDKTNIYLTSSYSIIYQTDLLELNDAIEKLTFFILVNDSNLKALTIYEEENKLEAVKKRCLEELGFFDLNLIKAEIVYHNTFYPEQEVSPFSIAKKR